MKNLYTAKYELKPNRWVFVPSSTGLKYGHQVICWIERRWRPPRYFFHFQKGGHVHAMKAHIHNEYFLCLDLEGFFHAVTRTKVHRALKYLHFGQRSGWEIAQDCTVKLPNVPGYRLPYGYPQSTILSSLALHLSAVGQQLGRIYRSGISVTCYVDDILISAERPEPLRDITFDLAESAKVSGFTLRSIRSSRSYIEALGITLQAGKMFVSEHTIRRFEYAMSNGLNPSTSSMIAYTEQINTDQSSYLKSLLPTGP